MLHFCYSLTVTLLKFTFFAPESSFTNALRSIKPTLFLSKSSGRQISVPDHDCNIPKLIIESWKICRNRTKHASRHILAPAAAAYDICPVRRSAHPCKSRKSRRTSPARRDFSWFILYCQIAIFKNTSGILAARYSHVSHDIFLRHNLML